MCRIMSCLRAQLAIDWIAVQPITRSTITITDSTGTGATATAFIQPQSAVLVHEETMTLDNDTPELASLFVRVIRVYETLPGPQVISQQVDQRGDLETTITQTVAEGTAPTADGLLVTASNVQGQDTVKATATTSTVPSYATLTSEEIGEMGALVTTVNDIVAPGSVTPVTGLLIVADKLDAQSATKSQHTKSTVASWPELIGSEQISRNFTLNRHISTANRSTSTAQGM